MSQHSLAPLAIPAGSNQGNQDRGPCRYDEQTAVPSHGWTHLTCSIDGWNVRLQPAPRAFGYDKCWQPWQNVNDP